MGNLLSGDLTAVIGPLALVLVMVLFVIPYGYKVWRNYYLGINSKNEAAWREIKASMHEKPTENRTPEMKKLDEELFADYTKSVTAEFIKKTGKVKYWTNYFLIFSIIMALQLAYAISHLLNQYYGMPSIGSVEMTTVPGTLMKAAFTSILVGVYLHKKKDLKERQVLLAGLANEYDVEGELTLEKLETLDISDGKTQSLEVTH